MNNEINKFNQLAQDWWDPQGPLKPLHGLNPLRLKFIQDQVNLTGKQVLDVGCGGGILTESLAKAGAVASGLDLASDVLDIAREHAQSQNLTINYHCMNVEDFAQQHTGQFDVITCMEMLEHVPDPSVVIKACAQLLKPNGTLFLSTLNRNLKSFLLAIIGAEYVLNLVPKGTHEYAKFITPAELSRLLREQNFELEKIQGMSYNPLNQEFKLSADCDVNYLLSANLA
ncbi:MAG: bifunctional 2-polyprenyl-6-hydroxyphenol methylase/3-demethylubiquinol 3-O-methyltransferase UbiG [Legionellales bacterium]|jgi:2-polyprenyl-6-hydroxyphenyl methylase/3-demethylubiquinone-9 3-methyltransferase